MLEDINKASGNWWKFKLVDGTGSGDQSKNESASMKITDEQNALYSANGADRGKVYTFDYYDADALLQGISFRPTLSNAQAIRTIYAKTNNDTKRTVLSDQAELLDYKFDDRLFRDDSPKNPPKPKADKAFYDTMASLQLLTPPAGAYQMTTIIGGKPYTRRLVLPDTSILNMIVDDGDVENNPKYTGIMPGIQAEFTIQGIGGLRTFMMFLVRNLPAPYSHKNVVFRIINLQENIDNGKWTTTITAGIIPLRGHIKAKLGIKT